MGKYDNEPLIPTSANTGALSPDQLMSELSLMRKDYEKVNPTTTGWHPAYNQGTSDADKYSADRRKSFLDAFNAQVKRMASREWYKRNRERKKAYNKRYYQDNVEYWKKRYQESVGKAVSDGSSIKNISRNPQVYNMEGGNTSKNNTSKWKGAGTEYAKAGIASDAKAEKLNYDRAVRDLSDYEQNHQPMSFGTAWKTGGGMLSGFTKQTASLAKGKLKELGSAFIDKTLRRKK